MTRRLLTMSMFAVVSIPHRVTRTVEDNNCERCAKFTANRFLQDICEIQLHYDAYASANRVNVTAVVIELKWPA